VRVGRNNNRAVAVSTPNSSEEVQRILELYRVFGEFRGSWQRLFFFFFGTWTGTGTGTFMYGGDRDYEITAAAAIGIPRTTGLKDGREKERRK
jgi:hypothetical protein